MSRANFKRRPTTVGQYIIFLCFFPAVSLPLTCIFVIGARVFFLSFFFSADTYRDSHILNLPTPVTFPCGLASQRPPRLSRNAVISAQPHPPLLRCWWCGHRLGSPKKGRGASFKIWLRASGALARCLLFRSRNTRCKQQTTTPARSLVQTHNSTDILSHRRDAPRLEATRLAVPLSCIPPLVDAPVTPQPEAIPHRALLLPLPRLRHSLRF